MPTKIASTIPITAHHQYLLARACKDIALRAVEVVISGEGWQVHCINEGGGREGVGEVVGGVEVVSVDEVEVD